MNIILGVDPGKSGGIAVLNPAGVRPSPGEWEPYGAIPMMDSLYDLYEYLLQFKKRDTFAYLELVHAMPGQGVSSTFKFGQQYGHLEMALAATGIPFERVTPQTWQRALGLTRKKDHSKSQHKARLRARAQELFPAIASKITLKTCDALLIAHYGHEKQAGRL